MDSLAKPSSYSSFCYSPLEKYGILDIKAFSRHRIGYVERRAIALLYRNSINEVSVDGLAKLVGSQIATARDMLVRWWSYGWVKPIDIDRYVVKWECIPGEIVRRCLKYLDGVVEGKVGPLTKRAIAFLYRSDVRYIAYRDYIDRVPRDGKAIAVEDLAEKLGITLEQAKRLVYRWISRGLLTIVSRGIHRIEWEKIPRYVIDIALLEYGDRDGEG